MLNFYLGIITVKSKGKFIVSGIFYTESYVVVVVIVEIPFKNVRYFLCLWIYDLYDKD